MKGLQVWHRASERSHSLIRLLIRSNVSACPLSLDKKSTYSYIYERCVSIVKTELSVSLLVAFSR